MRLTDFTKGQTAYLYGDGLRRDSSLITEAVVKTVGRKYVTIEGRWEAKFFEREPGDPYMTEAQDCGYRRLLFSTRQAAEDWKELLELRDYIRQQADHERVKRYSLDQLRAVKRILQEET